MASGTALEAPPPGFEGPEKNIEIDFVPGVGPEEGMRTIKVETWSKILSVAKCSILCSMRNEHVDAHVLSESSLFVYPHKVILKTCGTTTLLRVIPPLLRAASRKGMRVEWMAYTRKDFLYPHEQMFPHRSASEEITFLTRFFPHGEAFTLGPLNGDHWFVFVADYCERPSSESTDRTLDMMMFDVDESVAKSFWGDPSDTRPLAERSREVTTKLGIHRLVPGSEIQEWLFDPCGYSLNGLCGPSYWTIHVTPEEHCSYVSFETNLPARDYGPLVASVLAIFRPQRFTMTLFADTEGLRRMDCEPHEPRLRSAPGLSYRLTAKSHTEFMGDYCSILGNYSRRGIGSSPRARASSPEKIAYTLKTTVPPFDLPVKPTDEDSKSHNSDEPVSSSESKDALEADLIASIRVANAEANVSAEAVAAAVAARRSHDSTVVVESDGSDEGPVVLPTPPVQEKYMSGIAVVPLDKWPPSATVAKPRGSLRFRAESV